MRKIMWLLINNIQKTSLQQQTLTVRVCLVHSSDLLKQIITFVKFKLFQDQHFENHSAKNMEMCKDWFHISLLKITSFTIIGKS